MRTNQSPIYNRKARLRIAAAGLLTVAIGFGNVVTSSTAHASIPPVKPKIELPPIFLPPVHTIPPIIGLPPISLPPIVSIPPVIGLPPIDPCVIRVCDPPVITVDPCILTKTCDTPDEPKTPDTPDTPDEPKTPDTPQPTDPGQPEQPQQPTGPKVQPQASVDQAIPASPTFTG